jgi:N6-L-threonylcarbamoyladenine synthase
VVPEVAAREHFDRIDEVICQALVMGGLTWQNIDRIAVVNGPGLVSSLLVGVTAAKTLSWLLAKPLVAVNHLMAHICALQLQPNPPVPPFVCLLASGGHTQLVLMKDHLKYEIVGETLDDAAGEAFDKVARILGLGYPGGPAIAASAANFQFTIYNLQKISNGKILKFKKNIYDIKLPRPMINSKNFNFSFSGLKTAVLYLVKKNEKILKNESFVSEVCHEFQQAVADVLIAKTIKAAGKFHPKTIMLAGGVSANLELRKQLSLAIKKDLPHTSFFLLHSSYSLDNAAMIAAAVLYRWKENKSDKKFRDEFNNNWRKLNTNANLKLSN